MADMSLHAIALTLIQVAVVCASYLLLHSLRPFNMYMPDVAATLQAVRMFSCSLYKTKVPPLMTWFPNASKLYDPVTSLICGLIPAHFITLATPHMGCDGEGPAQVC